MKTTEEIFNILKERFGDPIIQLTNALREDVIEVKPLEIDTVSLFLRDDKNLDFDNCMLLSAVDDANGEKVNLDDGSFEYKGGTLSVFYHLESTNIKHKVTLKTITSRDNPEVNSVAEVWFSTDWHEREAYDLLGINFINHPDLRRILMPYDWEFSYPLRKDYKNPEYYQGMKVVN